MNKFVKTLKQGLFLYSLAMNPGMFRYMSYEEINSALDFDKE